MRILKLLRQHKKESQSDLAGLLGISQPTVSKIETGAIDPSPEIRRRLADHYCAPYGHLMTVIGSDVELSVIFEKPEIAAS